MSATTANAVKAKLEAANLGVPVRRDVVGKGSNLPYISVRDTVSVVPEVAFNGFDDPEHHVSETIQVDVWQDWRTGPIGKNGRPSGTGKVIENYELAERVAMLLDGSTLTEAPYPIMGVRMTGHVRLIEVDDNVVHNAMTFTVRRTMQRST